MGRTVAAFERLVGLKMIRARLHGGVANFHVSGTTLSGPTPLAGEQSGLQDALWGFGIRLAIASGVLAARSILERTDYDALWRRELLPWLQASIVNRMIYERCGNAGYTWALRAQRTVGDARRFLGWLYRQRRVTRLMVPWAVARHRSGRPEAALGHAD